MRLSAKMVSGDLLSGPIIYISFPVGFSNYEALKLTDKLNMFLNVNSDEPALDTSQDSYVKYDEEAEKTRDVAESTKYEQIHAETMRNEYDGWPSDGYVTIKDIVSYWNIGRSSFLERVRKGVFSKAAHNNRPANAPKVWEASAIGRDLYNNGYVRRSELRG